MKGESLMKPKKVRRIHNVIGSVLLGITILSFTPLVLEIFIGSYVPFFNLIRRIMIYVGGILAIGDIVFAFIFLGCPHCKRLLNFKWSSQGICHKCEARLED